MNAYAWRRTPGQSLPLIAFVIVVIIALVALSVDVGNAYGQQRQLQNAANAAATAAMSSTMANATNQAVWDSIKQTLAGNRIDTKSRKYRYKADYVFADRPPQLIGQWNMEGSPGQEIVPNADQRRPDNVIRIQVSLEEVVDTYFARVIGYQTLPVNVRANACPSGYSIGVYPIGIPRKLVKGYHEIYQPGSGTPLSTSSALWNQVASGEWDRPDSNNMVGKIVHLPIENMGGGTPPGSHIGWLNWGGTGAPSNENLATSLTYPGNLQNGFREGEVRDSSLPSNPPNGQLELLDWVSGTTGEKNSSTVDRAISNHISEGNIVILPMYSTVGGNGANASFYITKMGKFKIVEYNQQGRPKYLRVMYLGDAPAGAGGCASEVADGTDRTAPPKLFGISGAVRYNRVWRTDRQMSVSNDIILVMDVSGSMARDWYDLEAGDRGYNPNQQRIKSAKRALLSFLQNYDLRADPNARIALVKFGNNDRADTVMGWTEACAASQRASNCGGVSNKWKTMQDKINALSPAGWTPGPFAFEEAQRLLQSAQTTRADGTPVRRVVILATDGVFNTCGSLWDSPQCPKGSRPPCAYSSNPDDARCSNNAPYNMVQPRPVWQGIQLAQQIKDRGVSVFTIAMKARCAAGASNCFDPAGLPEMSSGSGYYFQASDDAALSNIYQIILSRVASPECVPKEQVELAVGARVILQQPGNPTVLQTTTADSEGRWEFRNLPAGEYIVKVDPYTKRSPEDGLTRTYSRLRNALDLSQEGQVSFSINPLWPEGSVVYGEALLSLPTDANGVPLNGCTTP